MSGARTLVSIDECLHAIYEPDCDYAFRIYVSMPGPSRMGKSSRDLRSSASRSSRLRTA